MTLVEAVQSPSQGHWLFTLFYPPGQRTYVINDDLSVVRVNAPSTVSLTGSTAVDQAGTARTLLTLVSPHYKTAVSAYAHSGAGANPISSRLILGYRLSRDVDLAPGYYDVLIRARLTVAKTRELEVTGTTLNFRSGARRETLRLTGPITLRRRR